MPFKKYTFIFRSVLDIDILDMIFWNHMIFWKKKTMETVETFQGESLFLMWRKFIEILLLIFFNTGKLML